MTYARPVYSSIASLSRRFSSLGLFIKTYLSDAYLKYKIMPKFSKISKTQKKYHINSVLYRHNSISPDEDVRDMINTFEVINNENI